MTKLAVGRHPRRRTVRVRLTLLYGGLFLLSGAALVAITYGLFERATEYTKPQLPQIPHTPAIRDLARTPALPTTLTPLAQALPQLAKVQRQLAQNQRQLFLSTSKSQPGARLIGSPPQLAQDQRQLTQDQHQLAQAVNQLSQAVHQMAHADSVETAQRAADSHELLIDSGIALAIVAVLALLAGWLLAGRMLRRLDAAFEAQRQFAANASHELRAPLTRQRALIQVALADPQASFSSLRAAHERALVSEQHLEQLIDGLLALSRGQAGLERREPLNLADLTFQALRARESQAAGLELDVRVTLDPAPIAGDPRLIERLIGNLIDNAIRHNTPGGQVQISTGTRDGCAFVSIANTGPTVPPEEIQRLFQPFQRLGAARTNHNTGHGLGLSIVRAIADAHGAELSADPRPDGGLRIDVSFRADAGAAPGATFAPVRTRGRSPRASLR